MKLVVATLLLVSLILLGSSPLTTADYGRPTAPPPASPPTFCDSKCSARCAKAGVMDRCLKYCGLCCKQCGCVPSGTYGNKSECPCYGNMKNSKGTSKCP
ncbi:peamaclein-like [Punica granatum]|uniref:Uncharacterized protein n=2 Tax=Punica granatum TaxID=22663 RepID=A0A218XB14_PUNGR|nr:peamaclein-like [Punica granatum]OWM82124.1 hypothetical protein CDL15_Pgr001698 [Punica granatum]PKI41243.1 hypothetical protein CRG98_038355 [Punica granatum]